MLVDYLDEFLDLLCFVCFKIEFQRYDIAIGIGWNVIDSTLSDFVVLVGAAVFNTEFIEVELNLLGISAVRGAPFGFRCAGFVIGDSNRFVFFVDFDAVDFARERYFA